MNEMTIGYIAGVCHEANKEYCRTRGDRSQLPWSEAPQWQRDSAIAGVEYHINNPDSTPADSHNEWMKHKLSEGWVYGELKDPEQKTHPCMVAYEDLPAEQRAKDALFLGIVRALESLLYRE